jgi:hypothetical protein
VRVELNKGARNKASGDRKSLTAFSSHRLSSRDLPRLHILIRRVLKKARDEGGSEEMAILSVSPKPGPEVI